MDVQMLTDIIGPSKKQQVTRFLLDHLVLITETLMAITTTQHGRMVLTV